MKIMFRQLQVYLGFDQSKNMLIEFLETIMESSHVLENIIRVSILITLYFTINHF